MPRSLAVVVLLLLALISVACASQETERADTSSSSTLVVASDLDNAPFAYVDADGRPAGRDVEMMEWIAGMLGRELRWERMPFDALLPACERGDVDVVCATLGITPERDRTVDFTRPYYETVIAVVARTGDDQPATLDDLAGKRVAGGPGTTSEKAIREHLRYAHGIFEGGKSTAEALRAGAVDAAAMDGPAARALVAGANGELRLIEGDLGPETYALALPSASPITEEIDRALRVLEARGDLADLNARWGL